MRRGARLFAPGRRERLLAAFPPSAARRGLRRRDPSRAAGRRRRDRRPRRDRPEPRAAPVPAIAAVAPVASLGTLPAIPSLPAASDRRPVARRRDDRAAPSEAIHLARTKLVDLERVQRHAKELAGPRDRVLAISPTNSWGSFIASYMAYLLGPVAAWLYAAARKRRPIQSWWEMAITLLTIQ